MNTSHWFHVGRADGRSIAVRTHGHAHKPAVVLSNGIGCTEAFWAHLVDALCTDFWVIEWFYRGHYISEPASDPQAYRVEDLALDLEHILAQLQIETAVFCAFSLGVMVTLAHYRLNPGRHRAMVLISGTYADPFQAMWRGALRPLILATLAVGRRIPRLSRRVLRHGLRSPFAVTIGQRLGFIEANVPRDHCRGYLARLSTIQPQPYLTMMHAMSAFDATEILPRVDVPVRVIAGTHDHMAPLPIMQALADAIPQASLHVIPNASHTLLFTFAAEISAEIRAFLNLTLDATNASGPSPRHDAANAQT